MEFLYIASDNEISYGVVFNGQPVNDATVTYVLRNPDLSPVANGSGTLSFVANGQYAATISHTVTSALVNGFRYFLDFTITSMEGNDFERQTIPAAYATPNATSDPCQATPAAPVTFQDSLRNDVPTVFLRNDGSGFDEPIVFTPKNGGPVEFTAIVFRGEDIEVAHNDDGLVAHKSAVVLVSACCTADIYDTFTIDGFDYAVTARPFNDGFGMKQYTLKLSTVKEKSHGGYRIQR